MNYFNKYINIFNYLDCSGIYVNDFYNVVYDYFIFEVLSKLYIDDFLEGVESFVEIVEEIFKNFVIVVINDLDEYELILEVWVDFFVDIWKVEVGFGLFEDGIVEECI